MTEYWKSVRQRSTPLPLSRSPPATDAYLITHCTRPCGPLSTLPLYRCVVPCCARPCAVCQNARHWCVVCRVWLDGKASSIRTHEEGKGHQQLSQLRLQRQKDERHRKDSEFREKYANSYRLSIDRLEWCQAASCLTITAKLKHCQSHLYCEPMNSSSVLIFGFLFRNKCALLRAEMPVLG
jgi:hypothetical protein